MADDSRHAPQTTFRVSFKDHFSGHAGIYQRYRPGYPPALFEFLSSLTARHEIALDCATGNGQAALALTSHYDQVVACDGSIAQLANARRHSRIVYLANLAEKLAVRARCVDLVTAAQAAHWFDFGRFYPEVARVLRAGGLVAFWTYEKFHVEPAIDAIIDVFYRDVVGVFWPPERRYVEEGYRTLPFPFAELPAPEFHLQTDWDLDTVMGYLATWSAVQRYRGDRGHDPLPALRRRLESVWGQAERTRSVEWPIHLRVGRPA